MSSKTKTTATNEEATPALVPKLRFPGFSEPWVHEPLSKVLKEHKLKNTDGRDVFSVSMEYGIVNQIELLGRSYAAANTSHYTIGRRFDVVYTKSPLKAFPFGIVKQCKFDGEVALSPLYGVFTPPNPHVGLMIEAYFEAPNRSKNFLSPLCQKGAKNTLQITNTTFLSGRLPLPTQPAEQQKIAECLSSVDELMAAQARKVDALKTHKKGLMQQLFPREGETQPRLRFPEFKNAGEWEDQSIGDFGKVVTGSTPSTAQPAFYGGGIPFVSPADISDMRFVDQAKNTLTAEGFAETRHIKAGSVLFVCIGSTIGKVAQNVHGGFFLLANN
jgi:type I restriction enzyme S subunit